MVPTDGADGWPWVLAPCRLESNALSLNVRTPGKKGRKMSKKSDEFHLDTLLWMTINYTSFGGRYLLLTSHRRSNICYYNQKNPMIFSLKDPIYPFSIYPFCSKKRLSAIDCGLGYGMEYFPCLAGQGLYNSTCNIIVALQWLIQRFDIGEPISRRIMKKVGVKQISFL